MAFLGAASIIIDQATLPPGVAGVSRQDGVTAQLVTLRNADNTNISVTTGGWTWRLHKPRGSAAALSSPTSPSCTFTPDVDGSYLIELLVNEGQKPSQKAKAVLGVKSVGGFRYPAQGESIEANWTSAYTGNPNETGWWESLDEILRSGQAAIDGTTVTVNPEAGLPNSRQLAVGTGLSLTDNGAGSTIVLDTAFTAGTQLLADVALQPENVVSTRATQASTRDATKYGQVNLGSEALAGKGTKANYATVGGGLDNLASGDGATCAGGSTNTASGLNAFTGGGSGNTASGATSSVLGGSGNTAGGIDSVAAGGDTNSASANRAGIVAGDTNTASGDDAFVGAGVSNLADGGGSGICAGNNNECSSTYGFVGAGQDNTAGATHSGIVAGTSNVASGDYSGILSGNSNTTGAANASVGGGSGNSAGGAQSHVGGGSSNSASATDSCVGGGNTNSASGNYSSSPGGRNNTAAGLDSHAWGRGATATNDGAIVIKDGSAGTVSSSATNEVSIYGSGNVRLMTNGGKLQSRLSTSSNVYGERLQGLRSTTDATAQTQTIATIPSGQDCTVTVILKGKQSGSANCKSLYYVATYTNNGGAVALTGAAHVNSTQATGLAAATVAVGISGATLELQFQGIAATTIRWSWDVQVHFGGTT